MSPNGTVRSPSSVAIRTSSGPASTMVPAMFRVPSTGRTVFTFTFSPTRRVQSSGRFSGRSTPGELTSSAYGPGSNPSRSRRRLILSLASPIASRSTPPSRSTMTRRIPRPWPRWKLTSTSSRPAAWITGPSRSSGSISSKETSRASRNDQPALDNRLDVAQVLGVAALELGQRLGVRIEVVDREASLRGFEDAAALPVGGHRDEVGGGGQLDVDLELFLQTLDRPQQRLGLGGEQDIHVDRRGPPAPQDRGGAAGQVAGSLAVGAPPQRPQEAADPIAVG